MRTLLSDTPVNSGRQFELDIARGLAVLFMIAVHALMVFADPAFRDSSVGTIIDFLGSPPAAPVFMFLLGAGLVYSRKSDPRGMIRRGLGLFAMGYVLSLFRLVLPASVGLWLGRPAPLPFTPLDALFIIDILQFAGITLVFFGALKALVPEPPTVLIIALGIAFGLANSLLLSVQVQGLPAVATTGLIWGSSPQSFFPFLTWIIYPLAGHVFATHLIRGTDKTAFYGTLMGLCLILAIPMYYLATEVLQVTIVIDGDPYYHHDAIVAVLFLLFTLAWIALCYFLTRFITIPAIVTATVNRWSKNVTEIYVIHWILIGWLAVWIGFGQYGLVGYSFIFIVVAAASDALAQRYIRSASHAVSETVRTST